MATHISPGVYSKIIDLSEYLTSTSGTIGFLPIITEKGPDNVLTKISSIEEYRTKFGDPNLKTFGKYYGQGPYVALNHLEVSSDLYVLRALPDDAAYAHSFVAFAADEDEAEDVDGNSTEAKDVGEESAGEASNVSAGETIAKLVTFSVSKNDTTTVSGKSIKFTDATDTQKLDSYFTGAMSDRIITKVPNIYDSNHAEKCILMYVRAYGRGDYYCNTENGGISYLLRADSNPNNFGLYNFEVYQYQDGSPVMVESYNVSFEPESLDADGESNYIEDVVNKFSTNVQVRVNEDALEIMRKCLHDYYDNDPTITGASSDESAQPDYLVDIVKSEGGVEKHYIGFPTVMTDENYRDLSLIPDYYDESVEFDSMDSLPEVGEYQFYYKTKDTNKVYYWDGTSYVEVESVGGIWIGKTLIADPATVTNPTTTIPSNYYLGIKAKEIWCAYWDKAVAKKATKEAAALYADAVAMDEDETITIDGVQMSRTEAIEYAIEKVEEAQVLTDAAQDRYDSAVAMSLMQLSDSDNDLYGEQPYDLLNGSLGSLVYTKNGKRTVQPTVANQTLCMAYSGLLKKPVVVRKVDESTGTVKFKVQYCSDVLDLDWIYFTIVYDAGYKPDVKQLAKELVETRMDCVLISDCGDNCDCEDVELYTGAVKGATDCRIWNSYLCARYEPYTRVYDQYNGCDQWLSPVYTMAKIIPQNDSLYDIWYAPAGFNRGVSSEIKELRWSANLGERDRLYSAQVNPIVYFPDGMTVWGQLTTQKKTSTLSDLNCVRTVLYIKRAVEQFCRNYIFEFNDAVTHERIKNGIIPLLSAVQASRGLKEYSIEVGATDYEYKQKICHVNITLAPMNVIEKIQCNFYIK